MKKIIGILVLFAASLAWGQADCGVTYDGSNPGNPPTNYNTLADPAVGQSNAVTSDYGCPVWKAVNMASFQSAMNNFDGHDPEQWILVDTLTTGGAGYFGFSHYEVHDIHTGALVCNLQPGIGGDYAWGRANTVRNPSDKWGGANDLDVLYMAAIGTNTVYRVNVAACAAGTKLVSGTTGPYMDTWDSLAGYTNLSWARTASDFGPSGNTICAGDLSGSDVLNPKLYNVGSRTLGPALTGGHVGASTFRSCRVNPANENQLLIQYQDTTFERFDGTTGAYINTIFAAGGSGHGAVVWYGSDAYKVQQISGNSADPTIAGCNSNLEMVSVSTGVRTCLNWTGNRGLGEFYAWSDGTNRGRVVMSFQDSMGIPTPTLVTASYLATHTSGTVTVTDAISDGNCSDTIGGSTHWAFCNYKTSDAWYPQNTATLPLASDWNTHWNQYYSAFRTFSTRAFNNEVFMVFLDGTPPVHLTHHRSIQVEYKLCADNSLGTCTPFQSLAHVQASKHYAAFSSTWGNQGDVSTYVLQTDTIGGISLVSCSVAPVSSSIIVGGTQAYAVTGTYSDSSTANITSASTFTSSNTSVATISGATATGVAVGTSIITATDGSVSCTSSLTVSTGISSRKGGNRKGGHRK